MPIKVATRFQSRSRPGAAGADAPFPASAVAPAVAARGKVLLCSNTSWYLYNFRLNLIRALAARGYDVYTAAPRDAYTERLRAHVVSHYDLDFSSSSLDPLKEVRLLIRFDRMLRDVGADVLMSYTAKPNIYGNLVARLQGVKVISNIAGLGSGFVGDSPRSVQLLLEALYRLAFSRTHCLFFQNADDHRLFVKNGIAAPHQSHVIPGSGVDTDHFVHHPVEDLPREPFRFLFSARMLRAKGVITFLEAAAGIEAGAPGRAQFVLCGSTDVDNRDAVPRHVLDGLAACKAVVLAGHVDDMLPVIQSCHCAVLPSYYREGVPRSLLEAMSVGRPIITTDMPGCRETVNGRNGWLIAPRSAAALQRAMTEAMMLPSNELAAMGLASRRYAEERFAESFVIQTYMERLDELLADGGRRRCRP